LYTEFLKNAFEGDKITGIRGQIWRNTIKMDFKARVFSRFTWLTNRFIFRVLISLL